MPWFKLLFDGVAVTNESVPPPTHPHGLCAVSCLRSRGLAGVEGRGLEPRPPGADLGLKNASARAAFTAVVQVPRVLPLLCDPLAPR